MQMWRRHTTTSCPMAFHRTGAKRKSKNVVEMAFLCKSFARINDVLTCVPFSILELRIVDIFPHLEWWRRGLVLRSFRFLAEMKRSSRLGFRIVAYGQSVGRQIRNFWTKHDKTWQNKIISPLKLQLASFKTQIDTTGKWDDVTMCVGVLLNPISTPSLHCSSLFSGPATALASKKLLGGVVLHSPGILVFAFLLLGWALIKNPGIWY